MPTGYLTTEIDIAQVVLYVFWIFFFGLILHLLRENKREGYPLDSDRSHRAPRVKVVGFPDMPPPKRWSMPHGEADLIAPRVSLVEPDIQGVINADRPLTGYPLQPMGRAMGLPLGPGSCALRRDIPDLTIHGDPKIGPMRVLGGYQIMAGDPTPIGMPVVAADGRTAGIVEDVWVDRAEPRILYFEVALDPAVAELAGHDTRPGAPPAARAANVLLPAGFAKVQARHHRIKVVSVIADDFAYVPVTAKVDAVTRREEDAIMGYFGGGYFYSSGRTI